MKLKKRLSKMFLGLAKKCDPQVMMDELGPMLKPIDVTMYDQYNVDKIHSQYQIANAELDAYYRNLNMNIDEMIQRKLSESITDYIMKVHKGDIKKTLMAESPWNESTLYSLDVYVCKPTKKGDI